MSFDSYKETVIQLSEDLESILSYCSEMNLRGSADAVESAVNRLKKNEFNVAVVGEFNRGKSTLLNALLGKKILPEGKMPTTAAVNKVVYGETPFVNIQYRDGSSETIDVDQLKKYVTKLTKDGEVKARTIQEAIIHYPLDFCKNGVTLIDTPGLSDSRAMTEITESILPQSDAAIMVMFGGSPVSESERRFLEENLCSGDIGRVLFVMTGIDLYDEEDQQRILDSSKKRIQEYVLDKAEQLYGKDSEIYESYSRTLGKIRIYGLSAKRAVKAKERDDAELLEESQFPVFENALEQFLTEDRGAITLSVPVNRIRSAALELYKAVQLREQSLFMQADKFNRNYQEAIQKMQDLRAQRADELAKIDAAAAALHRNLEPEIATYWNELEDAAYRAIDLYPITETKQLKQARTSEQILEAVKQAMETTARNKMERIRHQIEQALAKEADRLGAFEEAFYGTMNEIQNLFIPAGAEKEKAANIALGVIGNYFTFGLGSVYDGYQKAGWKGALIGGGTGTAVTFASSAGIGFLIGLLSLPTTYPVLIAAGCVSAFIGLITGRSVLDRLTGKDSILDYKNAYKDALKSEFTAMRADQNISGQILEQVDKAFASLKSSVNEESERYLNDTQTQLGNLKLKVEDNSSETEEERRLLDDMLEHINIICERANVLDEKIARIMNSQEGLPL
ncbi:MAG: dynamin family protein [Lachnospiraceae bacterium]|nr:dynamin family protein [Lachnospiraceae bacterium]